VQFAAGIRTLGVNYWRDIADNRIFHAVVMLTDAENPNDPAKVISVPNLLAQERFVEIFYGEDGMKCSLPLAKSVAQAKEKNEALPNQLL